MEKEHNYVECQSCNWRVANGQDMEAHPCKRCNNTRKIIDPNEVLCNLCGGCMCPIGTMNEQYPHGLHEAQVTGGYDSYHLFDMTTYIFSFCEKCLRQLFIQCKVKPRIYDTNLGDDFKLKIGKLESWDRDIEAYEYRLWRDNGGYHQAFLNKKCNTIVDCPNNAKYTVLYSSEDNFSEDTCCEDHKTDRAWAVNARFVPFISNILKPFL